MTIPQARHPRAASIRLAAALTLVLAGCSAAVSGDGGGGTTSDVGPVITTPPTNQTVNAGQSATFTVVATGTPAPTYQWRKNVVDVAGATSAAYTTPTTTADDDGAQFSVRVSNRASDVVSAAATLTVNSTSQDTVPTITTQPKSITVPEEQTATFSVTAHGTAPLSYQWYVGNAVIPGATSATYTTPPTTLSDSGWQYSVVVANAAGSVTSSFATLTVSSGSSSTWVVGSHPEYHWDELPADRVPYDHMTHLFLSFLWPKGSNGNYSMTVTEYGPSPLAVWKTEARKFIDGAHAAGVKVVVDIGGANGAVEVFQEGTQTDDRAAALAKAIVDTCKDIGLDGVDLDWEPLDIGVLKEGAPRLLKYLRKEWPDGIVTVAVGPSYGVEQVELAQSLATVEDDIDAIMIMSYVAPDQTWTGWLVPVPLTPLHGAKAPWDGLPQPYSLDREVDVWTKQAGVAASKLVIGVGGFGLAWGDTKGDGIAPVEPYANYDALDASGCGVSQWTCSDAADTEKAPIDCTDNHVTQQWVDQVVDEAGGRLTLEQDTIGDVDYWAAPARDQLVKVTSPCNPDKKSDVSLIFYETPRSMRAKLDFVKTNGLLGMEFWTIWQTQNASGVFPNLEIAKP